MEKGRILIGFSISLLGYVFSMEGISLYIGIILTGIIAILTLLILLRDKFPRKFGNKIEEISQGVDVSWVALGLGLLGFGIKSLQIGAQFKSEPLMWLGIVILILAAMCVGIANGRSGRKLLDNNIKVAIIFGFICAVGGCVWLIFSWIVIDASTILSKINHISGQFVIFFMGIFLIYLGLKRLRDSHRWSYKNDFDFDKIYE